jgi:hypothetical protein
MLTGPSLRGKRVLRGTRAKTVTAVGGCRNDLDHRGGVGLIGGRSRPIADPTRARLSIQLPRAFLPGTLLRVAGLFHLIGRAAAQALRVTGAGGDDLKGHGKCGRKGKCGAAEGPGRAAARCHRAILHPMRRAYVRFSKGQP